MNPQIGRNMKNLTSISLIAASFLILAPKPAVAGNSEIAALGGFIGGLMVGSNFTNYSSCEPEYYSAAPVVVYDAGGYWRTNSIRVWVGPQWVMVVNRYNRPVRRLIEGHYEIRQQRIWVNCNFDQQEYSRYDRNDRRHDRRSSARRERNSRDRNRY